MRPWLERVGSEGLSIRCAAIPGIRRLSTTDVSAGHQGWVEVRGFEPLTSSVRVIGGMPLCRPAFPQVDSDRRFRRSIPTVRGEVRWREEGPL